MANAGFLLLSTAGCHLCEEAEQLINSLNVSFDLIDIAEQEQWQPEYALRIPVLYHVETHRDLGWPFTVDQVKTFIN